MSIWDKLKGELIDIIQWLDDSQNTIVHRFERYNNEIKYGAKLVVRESQAAVFVNEGRLADVFAPGTYMLETRNLPILATILGWKYGFESPFKAEVYFVSTRQFTDLKWGTMNPVMRRDPEFGPVRLRAFGTYAMRVKDPGALVKNVAGTDSRFTTDEFVSQLRNVIVARFSDTLGEAGIPILDLAANYDQLAEFIHKRIQPEFDAYGIELAKLLIENISLPPEVEQALDKRSSMGIIGNLNAYAQYQTAQAIEQAAKNPGGAGSTIAMGMGFGMAGTMGQAMQQGAGPGGAAPPPLPQSAQFYLGVNGQQQGPFDLNGLRAQVAAGTLTRDTLAWRQGMVDWQKAGQVMELAQLFSSAPPPLPPKP
ncbi:MAG: SPFH domain-containing protein [Phycisphaerales bacterium]|nr:SPFH domain-containing protein [Phycisphaerales bacterium]